MSKLTKNQKIAYAKVEAAKAYKLSAMILLPLDVPVADALRYILAAGDSKIFSFTLADTWMPEFLSVCEKYLENHVEHRFEQLDMLDFD